MLSALFGIKAFEKVLVPYRTLPVLFLYLEHIKNEKFRTLKIRT